MTTPPPNDRRPNDFALAYTAAHNEAGMTRVSVAHLLDRIDKEPDFLFSEDFTKKLGGQCPVHHGARPEDFEKIVVNTTLAHLYEPLRQHITKRLPLTPEGFIDLPSPPESPTGLDTKDREGLAKAPAEQLCSFLRDCSCHLLDAMIREWAIAVMTEEDRCRQDGQITSIAAASYMLNKTLGESLLYKKSGYDILSITKTGSHTALHVCWNVVEVAPMLLPGLTAEEYEAIIRRSLKHVVPLSMGSLGMLVTYMSKTKTEHEDHLAIHALTPDQTAFIVADEKGEPVIQLDPNQIEPFAKEGEHHYTGCPAFYVNGMIKLYLEIVLAIAYDYQVYDRLQPGAT